MHFNSKTVRDELLKKMPNDFDLTKHKVLSFINLCIYPLRWEHVYDRIRNQQAITQTTYDGLKGAIAGMLVLCKRKNRFYHNIVDETVVDWCTYIRMDKKPNPERFLLNWCHYMNKYLFAKGLQVAFNVDWRIIVFDALTLKKLPKPQTYNSLFTNPYLKELIGCFVIYKRFREKHDEEYEEGKNDLLSLYNKQKAKSKLKPEQFDALYDTLVKSLPSWNTAVRKKASFAIEHCLDGYYLINVSLNPNIESELERKQLSNEDEEEEEQEEAQEQEQEELD
jgi:hypothetical protein